MWLKNNSSNEWLQYDCGCGVVDIKANSVFEVNDQVGEIILRGLGCEAWITETTAPVIKKEVKKEIFKKKK